ncbi:MAG: flagellar assembly protein FliH [Methylococcaceae bacterium]|nr:flagellar assembly protein FliH [Methylococcaceae bacterium]MDP3904040.1 flagellar assembly protein FliH [Methylococcaceae bacterium]
MSLSKKPRFSEAELEMLRIWSLPDVSNGEENEAMNIRRPPPVTEPTPVLTVEEIEAMQTQAYDESFQQGQKDGFQQGYDQGYEQGLKQGYEEKIQLLEQQAAQFSALMTALSEPFKELDEEVEKELVKLSIAVATQIIRREIKLDPGQIVAAVKQAINVLPLSAQKITLYLHPEDAELVRSALSLDDISPAWAVIEDPLITRGGCKVDTDVSHIDASVENRLAAVIANLLGGERGNDNKENLPRFSEHAADTSKEDVIQEAVDAEPTL